MMRLISASFFCLVLLCGKAAQCVDVQPVKGSDDSLHAIEPANGQVLTSFLTATVSWQYPMQEKVSIDGKQYPYWSYRKVHLRVWPRTDREHAIVDVDLPENVTKWRFPVLPDHEYVWQLIPGDEVREYPDNGFEQSFTSGPTRIDLTTDSWERYGNPRPGAHFRHMKPVQAREYEPLSPWYDVKAYTAGPMPSFAELKPKLPTPVLDGHPVALDMYWYAWKTFIEKWNFAPDAPDHQAVANINGTRAWGPWGSSVLWDNASMMYFARYGDQAYPFIRQYDNAYARQHENGFISMEVDKNNHELYVWYPVVVPPLISWAEWTYYQSSGDLSRLKRVFLPIVKNYEWWMTYMRRPDGYYWKQGQTEQERLINNDDGTLNYAVGANCFQAVEALYLAKIAAAIGRPDMESFFTSQHESIGNLVNARNWDTNHGIYNDRYDPKHPILAFSDPSKAGLFIPEPNPNYLHDTRNRFVILDFVQSNTHTMFQPLFAQIVPKDRQQLLIQRLMDFTRTNGISNPSGDTQGYEPPYNGAWPIEQLMSHEGLKAVGRDDLATKLATKYFDAFVEAFGREKSIRESIYTEKPRFSGADDFVGWGGIAPITDLIRYVIGLDISVPDKTIAWRIERTERNGIENLRFGNFPVTLICEPRSSAAEPAHLSITSGGSFDLKLIIHGKTVNKHIEKGTVRIDVG